MLPYVDFTLFTWLDISIWSQFTHIQIGLHPSVLRAILFSITLPIFEVNEEGRQRGEIVLTIFCEQEVEEEVSFVVQEIIKTNY